MTRTRLAERRTLPWSTLLTFRRAAISLIWTALPLNENDEVWAATFKPATWLRAFKISSASPSLEYSFSLFALKLAKGRTAMDELVSSGFDSVQAASSTHSSAAV